MKSIPTITCLVALAFLGCGEDTVAPPDDGIVPPPVPTPLTWRHTQRTPVSESLRAIDGFADTHIAVGFGGAILIKHGNEDWRALEREFDTGLAQIQLISEKKAIIGGGDVILRTEDAGVTWKVVYESPTVLADVSMHGAFGIAVGSEVVVSDDEGETWRAPTGVLPTPFLDNVAHQTDVIATASSSANVMFRTIDGGQNWTQVAVAELPRRASDLAFYTEKFGTAALDSPARVFWTNDGGDTWSERASFGNGFIAALDVVDASTGYAVLSTGQVHVTRDAGKSWAFETSIPLEDGGVSAIDASDPSHWFAVGSFGFVSESRNAGGTWQQVSEGRTSTFNGIAFLDENVGVAAISPRLVPESALRTTDGGATWTPVDPQIERPERVYFSDSGIGLMIGREHVSKSDDRGATWGDISPPTNDTVYGVAILDDLTYVICGEDALVFRSTDGGALWQDLSLASSSATLQDIAFFPDGTTGVIVGEEESYRSIDAGLTWSPVNLRAERSPASEKTSRSPLATTSSGRKIGVRRGRS